MLPSTPTPTVRQLSSLKASKKCAAFRIRVFDLGQVHFNGASKVLFLHRGQKLHQQFKIMRVGFKKPTKNK